MTGKTERTSSVQTFYDIILRAIFLSAAGIRILKYLRIYIGIIRRRDHIYPFARIRLFITGNNGMPPSVQCIITRGNIHTIIFLICTQQIPVLFMNLFQRLFRIAIRFFFRDCQRNLSVRRI